MATYANGQIPLAALSPIPAASGQTAYLLPAAAESFLRVAAEAKRLYGFALMATSAGDGFRSDDRQRNVFLQRYRRQATGGKDVRWWDSNGDGIKERWVRHTGAAAAVPGTSNHGKGITVDITGLGGYGTTTWNRIASLLAAEGWSNAEGRSVNEPWHWNYTRSAEPISNTNNPIPQEKRSYLQVGDSGPRVKAMQEALIRRGFSVGPAGADGHFGQGTEKGPTSFQSSVGLSPDGVYGNASKGALENGSLPAPAFPLPAGHYFGPKTGGRKSISGYFNHRGDLKRWRQRMKDRGWNIDPDGLYGDQTGDVAELFQREKGLTPDRKIGPATWAAARTAPIT